MKLKPPLENAVQREIVSTIRQTVFPCTVFAIPNGSRRTVWQQRQAKNEGVLRGVLDLGICWPGGSGWIECKRPGWTASAVSVEQQALLKLWTGWGLNIGIASTPDEALALLQAWGAPVRVQSTAKATPAPILECFAGIGE